MSFMYFTKKENMGNMDGCLVTVDWFGKFDMKQPVI